MTSSCVVEEPGSFAALHKSSSFVEALRAVVDQKKPRQRPERLALEPAAGQRMAAVVEDVAVAVVVAPMVKE